MLWNESLIPGMQMNEGWEQFTESKDVFIYY